MILGDPIEAASIRKVFGGSQRAETLWLGSVKGSIGHLEAASGAAALIKSVLMIQKAFIPPQASFVSLNPRIPPLSPDKMEISMTLQPWKSDFRSVFINNYGAAGSNAAMMVCQPSQSHFSSRMSSESSVTTSRHLFLVTAHSLDSLKSFCTALQRLIVPPEGMVTGFQSSLRIANLAFNLAHKQNHKHQYRLITSASNASELWSQLEEVAQDRSKSLVNIQGSCLPVVLCFGGQINSKVGLSKVIYDNCAVLRIYLDKCDAFCQSLGTTIFPYIFDKEPVADIVSLHCSLFSLQYSCAKVWIDSGVQVGALIGHSFGQLTALCVSGVLSLQDALKFIAKRASLIETHWGPDCGAMLLVKASSEMVMKIISLSSDNNIEIACHNGPETYVLVGSTAAIDAVQTMLSDALSPLGIIPAKRLQVTHGFHSTFVDAILPGLREIANDLTFNEPRISIETCSKGANWVEYGPELIVAHSREAVFFEDAVRRIERRLGPCIWLEAGSMSSITKMASTALGRAKSGPPNSFLPLELATMDSILDTTVELRRKGINAHYWPYHNVQREQFANINLPPYQFEKTRHWLQYKDTPQEIEASHALAIETPFDGFMRLTKYENSHQPLSEFEINPMSQTFRVCAEGHAVLGNSLCPISLYFEIVATAIKTLNPKETSSASLLRVEDLIVHAALGVDQDRACRLILTQHKDGNHKWDFNLVSQLRSDRSSDWRNHASGIAIISEPKDSKLMIERRRYQRLIGLDRCDALLSDPNAESMQGPIIYRTFDRVVHYQDYYRGVKSVAAKNGEVAGLLLMPATAFSVIKDTFTNPLTVDSFLQVAGIHVNSLRELGRNELYVCTSIRSCQMYRDLGYNEQSRSWKVYSSFDSVTEKLLENDIFVFDAETGSLDMAFWGVQFTKLQANTFERVLSSVNRGKESQREVRRDHEQKTTEKVAKSIALRLSEINTTQVPHEPSGLDFLRRLKTVVTNLTDVPSGDIDDDATFDELGIDSLMVNEVLVDIKKEFLIDVLVEKFQELETVSSLASYLQSKAEGVRASDNLYLSVDSEELEESIGFDTPASFSGNSLSESVANVLAEHLDLPESIPLDLNLQDAGLDSLLSMEVQSDIAKEFGVTVTLSSDLSFGKLLDMISNMVLTPTPPSRAPEKVKDQSNTSHKGMHLPRNIPSFSETTNPAIINPESISSSFSSVRRSVDKFAQQTHQSDFYVKVFPQQSRLVIAYIVEAFADLGCPLGSLKCNDRLPDILYKPMHKQVVVQIHNILENEGLIISSPSGGHLRTEKEINVTPACTQYVQIIKDHPQHAFEHRLLNISGPRLAECLSGSLDPLSLIFGCKANKELLENVYTHAPMFVSGTLLLNQFLVNLFSQEKSRIRPVRILEVGAGTGGTTKAVLNALSKEGIQFEYSFTDISASLVNAAKKKFSQYSSMDFGILDIETHPPEQLLKKFDIILSTNCIHATKRLVESTTNIQKMLRDDGVLCLIELTKNLPWFDLVFGLLEGWWRFEDGRTHALVDEIFWGEKLTRAGFSNVNWTKGNTEESKQLQLIIASKSSTEALQPTELVQRSRKYVPHAMSMETVTYREEGSIPLLADIYYPTAVDGPTVKRPIGGA